MGAFRKGKDLEPFDQPKNIEKPKVDEKQKALTETLNEALKQNKWADILELA